MSTDTSTATNTTPAHVEEITPPAKDGMTFLILGIAVEIVSLIGFISVINRLDSRTMPESTGVFLVILCLILMSVICPLIFVGLKAVKPNEALVLTLFGKYHGTLRKDGFYFVNPFCVALPQPNSNASATASTPASPQAQVNTIVSLPGVGLSARGVAKRISLKTMTLNNDKQKINDSLGNPIIIGIVVIWRVQNTAKAMFSVDNYFEFLSIQCDSSLRNIVRMYPYDIADDESKNEKSLRGSSLEIAEKLKDEIQAKVAPAGLDILEARITHLAYAPEIAAAMLQRQQAAAIVDARQLIVEGAVGMVEMALKKLRDTHTIDLDEERKAAMVSNLMVVLCSNKDATPVVNSGSLY